jgi:TatD DNase family protein
MTLKYFDAHTHLNMGFEQDWQAVGKRTLEAGINFVNIGADEKSSKLALEQVKELGNGCWSTVGIHPTCHAEASGEGGLCNFEVIKELAKDDKVVAIGECGLESFKLTGDIEVEKERQKKLFKQHIDLALEVNKPLMIHCRASEKSTDAYDDVYEILKSYKAEVGDRLRFNMHFFTSDWVTAQKFLDLGGYLSFPGVITFSDACDKTIKNMPLDRIMAETDAPFATPKVDPKAGFATSVPCRGSRNEPAYVQYVAERIAELRPEPREQILTTLVENAVRFFNLA